MFAKSQKPAKPDAVDYRPSPAAQQFGVGKAAVPSIIAADMTIVGDLKSHGELHVEGAVEGDIDVRKLVIGPEATVRGEIRCDTIRLCGAVTGKITAREVTVAASGRMTGDVHHEVLAVEAGARIEGLIKRLEGADQAAGQVLAIPSTRID